MTSPRLNATPKKRQEKATKPDPCAIGPLPPQFVLQTPTKRGFHATLALPVAPTPIDLHDGSTMPQSLVQW